MKLLFLAVLCQVGARRLGGGSDLYNLPKVDCSKYTGLCTMELRAVCGSDGQTRGNPCAFLTEFCINNQDLKFKHWGRCSSKGRSE